MNKDSTKLRNNYNIKDINILEEFTVRVKGYIDLKRDDMIVNASVVTREPKKEEKRKKKKGG